MLNWFSFGRRRTTNARTRSAQLGRFSLEALETRCLLNAVTVGAPGHGLACHCGMCVTFRDSAGREYSQLGLPSPDLALIQEGDGAAGGAAAGSPNGTATLDLAQTFRLNSLPGAKHTIYLDFDGSTASGTSWNGLTGGASIVTPAFDIDGNPAAFSDAELARIQYIWQRVAEDYAPFNVNVSTQDPGVEALRWKGSTDTRWGIRVAVGGSGAWYGAAVAGVAFNSSFTWDTDTPAFVFSQKLSGNEKNVAEAISHEVGHTLGLSHDGTGSSAYYTGSGSGATRWAPIMGSAYSANLSQFSKGEYKGANTQQDDLAIITTQNGFGYRPDDYGNTISAAFGLTPSGNAVSGKGIIEQNTDNDMFGFFTGAGTISFNVVPADRGPNLDIQASLYDATGNLIATNNPTGVLSASLTATVGAGKYYLKIEGAGEGDPLNGGYSDYGSLGQYWFTGTIVNATVPVASVGSVSKAEGNAGTTAFVFTVSLSQASTAPVTVSYATADGTAAAGTDYTALSGSVTFAPGETTKAVTVYVLGDTAVEPDETFVLKLTGATGATIGAGTGTATIANDDVPTVSVSVNSVSKAEGNAGTTAFVFTVSLSQASTAPVTVSYATADGTAAAGTDYTALSGSVTFAPGETTKAVTVYVLGDTAVEPDETFVLKLTGATGATIGAGTGTATIANDDDPPPAASPPAGTTVSVSSVRKSEWNSGVNPFAFTVSLSQASATAVTVYYSTADGTADAGSDYVAAAGSVTFAPGETKKTVTLYGRGDGVPESDETFFLNITSTDATVATGTGTGTIVNDDKPSSPPVPVASVGSVSKAEGNAGTTAFVFTVSLSQASTAPVTVSYATADGTAAAGTDYTALSGSVTFAPGETTKAVTVYVLGDTAVEPDETFVLKLTGATGATIGAGTGTATIANDDDPPPAASPPAGTTVSVSSVRKSEWNSGVNPFAFTVSLSQASATAVTVYYSTADGTADAGSDYVAAAGSVTFAPGETKKTVTLYGRGDGVPESDETFFLNITSTDATVATGTGTGTIVNDDKPSPAALPGGDALANAALPQAAATTTNSILPVAQSFAQSDVTPITGASAFFTFVADVSGEPTVVSAVAQQTTTTESAFDTMTDLLAPTRANQSTALAPEVSSSSPSTTDAGWDYLLSLDL